MIRRFVVAITAAVAALALSSCTVDCEICAEYAGVKECETATEVKRSECSDCTDEAIASADEETTTADVKDAKAMGVAFTCEKK
jgi:hypothetical protein